MARRELLHRNKLEEFKQFLNDNDIEFRDGRGTYEVIQINMGDGTWQCIFNRLRGDHYTVPNPLVRLVERFIDARKNQIH